MSVYLFVGSYNQLSNSYLGLIMVLRNCRYCLQSKPLKSEPHNLKFLEVVTRNLGSFNNLLRNVDHVLV